MISLNVNGEVHVLEDVDAATPLLWGLSRRVLRGAAARSCSTFDLQSVPV